MKIGFDLRSLASGTISGVENYCVNLLQNLLQADKQNQYLLFYNSFKKPQTDFKTEFQFVNSQICESRIPSKILNLAFKFNAKKIEDFTGELDWFFMPNLNQFSLRPNTKLAITVHDLSPVVTPEFYDIKRNLWHKFLNYKKAFERADILFAVSEYTKKDLINIFNLDPKKIVVAYPASNLKINQYQTSEEILRQVRHKYELPGNYLLFLNTIEPRKNLAGTIKAFERLNLDVELIIAGRLGWKYAEDFKLIKRSKKSDKIKYIGYIQETDKDALIMMAKALVYPSFYEGFGFQALEAMSLGTPVIASQLTSLPEVVGEAGLLVNPYDVNSLTLAMEKVLTDRQLRGLLVDHGLKRAQEFFWQKTAQAVINHL